MQSLHCFLDGCPGVESVNLQQIDVRSIKPLERGFDLVEDGTSGETKLILVVLHLIELIAKVELPGL